MLSLLLVFILFPYSRSDALELPELEWEYRPLVIFAPVSNDLRLQETQSRLQKLACELNDRKMMVGVIIKQGTNTLGSEILSISYSKELRHRYNIQENDFTVLLFGKDGDVKYRTDAIPDLREIFALIDGMPMRQQEMYQNPVDCALSSIEVDR